MMFGSPPQRVSKQRVRVVDLHDTVESQIHHSLHPPRIKWITLIVLAYFSPIASLCLFALLAIFYNFDQQAAAEAAPDANVKNS